MMFSNAVAMPADAACFPHGLQSGLNATPFSLCHFYKLTAVAWMAITSLKKLADGIVKFLGFAHGIESVGKRLMTVQPGKRFSKLATMAEGSQLGETTQSSMVVIVLMGADGGGW